MKTEVQSFITHTTDYKTNPDEFLNRYSSLTKTTRVLGYCLRFIQNLKCNNKTMKGPLNISEIQGAKMKLIILQQINSFPEELRTMQNNQPISRHSKLFNLNPFIDKFGILRVGGRLQNSELQDESKNPVILPAKSLLTEMIIDMAHKKTMHGGAQLTLTTTRLEHWIINGTTAVKSRIKKCIICQRFKATNYQQLMGSLPKPRVTADRPFTNTGIDYAGPIKIRAFKGRGQKSYKGYVAVFICLSTKAVHIEVVSELTTEAFLAALKRFISRRGLCKNIYSDNGTNFVGAHRKLDNDLKQSIIESTKKAALYATNEGIKWHFIPPAAPHFGGLWEAAVKSFKHHFKRIIGETTLTFEELTTFAAQTEAILNSRPLRSLTNNIEDLLILTPGHFLIGSSLSALPGPALDNQKITTLERWKLIEKMTQDLWKVWATEYLSTLQIRYKWRNEQPNYLVGQLVLLKEDLSYPTKWPLARIVATHPGKDGLVRVVTVKCRNMILKRPVSKLAPLISEDNNRIAETAKSETTVTLSTTKLAGNKGQKRKRSPARNPMEPRSKVPARDWLRGVRNPLVTNIVKSLKSKTCDKKPKVKVRPWINAILYTTTILSLIVPANQQLIIDDKGASAAVTPFESQPGIFFDEIGRANMIRSEWKLVTYYDLTNYWLEIKHLQEAGSQLHSRCKNNNTFLNNQAPCSILAQHVNHLLNEISERNQMLQRPMVKRRKRGAPLEIIGSIANGLFGILDQKAADIYNNQISDLYSNQQDFVNLLEQQISIVESTTNVIKRNRELIMAHYEVVQGELESVMFHEEFIDAAVQIILISISFKDTQDAIIDVITDVHHGRINNLLFTASQFDEQLQHIQNSLPSHLDLPTRQIVQLYRLLNIKARVLDNKIIFELKIPLIEREIFQILNTIPLPTLHNERLVYIKPSTNYMFVSIQRTMYYLATEMEVQACQQIKQQHFICNIHGPLHNDKADLGSCELGILRHEPEIPASCNIRSTFPTMVWVQLHKSNAWLFTADKTYTFDNICGTNITPITISGSGILHLPSQCTIKGDTFILHSKASYASYTNKSFVPSFNLTQRFIKQRLPITTDNSDIEYLEAAMNKAKELQGSSHEINNHHIHHYSTTSVLLIAVIIIATYLLWKNKCSNQQYSPSPVRAPTTAV